MALQLFREILTDASMLSDFTCGLQVMDDFIHYNLQSFLDSNSCLSYCLKDENEKVVAFFILQSDQISIVDEDTIDDMQLIHPNLSITSIEYKTIEIEYLAVATAHQRKGIGTECIRQILDIAKEQQRDTFFLTVDAYKSGEYSAVPFYRKCGFDALDIFAPTKKILPMYKPLYE
jgi:ribosomal protein S18 acetylase RimI-like enzyme